ncbi:DASH family cryptochrome [Catenovulum maritimum]|uniref:Cryptochrome DASH n=1 Tax=Catenovulum maritimum TaxID=1513271 RepID=A0A0J8GZH6_9ALTE|nr:DASH family cryptochrome [Catenovulum maritimum]KMT66639.1 hypothetical protein XM47_00425 [Catenovulum maritimum]
MRSIFLFTNDLRLNDNPALLTAIEQSDELVLLYCLDPASKRSTKLQTKSIGHARSNFLTQSLKDLQQQIKLTGQILFIEQLSVTQGLSKWIELIKPDQIFSSVNAGYFETLCWQKLEKHYNKIKFIQKHSHTLFDAEDLPFELTDLPQHFTAFRKIAEKLTIPDAKQRVDYYPPLPSNLLLNEVDTIDSLSSKSPNDNKFIFSGGESAAIKHLNQFFSSPAPLTYKETRNALEGWGNSSKWSPWLANGSVSARSIYKDLKLYEQKFEKNESTYWLFFELLWREYFQWNAHKQGKFLYLFKANTNKPLLNSFYPVVFLKWRQGLTPYPIVNACMHQLNSTGYLSNRGRQIVASCCVNEMRLDWRYGAAWFEQQLIDYDPASNWGNWQYIAGVGADPRGGRHFNLDKQKDLYDPDDTFINKWQGKQNIYSDFEDMNAWPKYAEPIELD